MAAGGTPTRPADAATPARIFISYRRADSAGFARAVVVRSSSGAASSQGGFDGVNRDEYF